MEFSKEEKKAIETLKEVASDDFDTLGDDISPKMAQNILNLVEKKQKEIEDYKQLIFYFKDKLNNINFETETGWRKIEKLEKIYGEIFGEINE